MATIGAFAMVTRLVTLGAPIVFARVGAAVPVKGGVERCLRTISGFGPGRSTREMVVLAE